MSHSVRRRLGAALLALPLLFAPMARAQTAAPEPKTTESKAPAAVANAACENMESGYYIAPGSDLCLRAGGFALGQLDMRSLPLSAFGPNPGAAPGAVRPSVPLSTFGAGPAFGVTLDAKWLTESGPATAHVAATTAFGGGLLSANPAAIYAQGANLAGANPASPRNFTRLDQAWLRYGGWTLGRAQSVFDFYADAWNIMPLRGSNARTEQISWRFSPMTGVEAGLSLENNLERRNLIGQAINPVGNADYAGPAFPDAVAAVRVENPFGLAQISGAAHELRTRYASPGQPDIGSNQWGFAAQGGLKVNVPSLSDADAMILQATFARGATAYLTGDNQPLFGGVNDPGHPGIATPRLGFAPGVTSNDYDCVSVAQPFGRCDKSTGYALVAAFKHVWTPTVSTSVFASFFGVNYSDAARAGASGVEGASNYRETSVGGNLAWAPLRNLLVGGEVAFSQGKSTAAAPPALNAPPNLTNAIEWSGRIRVQHNF